MAARTGGGEQKFIGIYEKDAVAIRRRLVAEQCRVFLPPT
jgi:hypothetical protein